MSADALRAQARKGVRIRIVYDHAADPGPSAIPAASPSHLEADQKPPGTDSFVRSFADVAEVKGVTGYRVLMHNKYIIRDAASADAAVFTGSSNYTNDSWGLQDNNLLCLRSQQLGLILRAELYRPLVPRKDRRLDRLPRHRHGSAE